MDDQTDTAAAEPNVSQHQEIFRICLVYNKATKSSHPQKQRVRKRLIDPETLPSGTWAVQDFEEEVTMVNGDTLSTGAKNPRVTLVAQRLYAGKDFAKEFKEVSQALRHDRKRPVIQVSAAAYEFNSEDLSSQYRVVPKGVRVIDQQGEIIWPKFRKD